MASRSNNNVKGWHFSLEKLAGKANPDIYEAITLFQSEQAAMEVKSDAVGSTRAANQYEEEV